MLLNVTIPVLNEEVQLEPNITQLVQFLDAQSLNPYEVIIVDNGSTDQTSSIGQSLSLKWPNIRFIRINETGRGRAIKRSWSGSCADILSYMDVDLSTDLEAFPTLIRVLATNRADLAVGTRVHPQSTTERGWKREVLSRTYNWVIKTMLSTQLSDVQCGFKAIRREAATRLLPFVEDNGWFFDTELLILAEAMGYEIREIPVNWKDDLDSRVNIMATIWTDLKGVVRMRNKLLHKDDWKALPSLRKSTSLKDQ
jgi:glycosyltransferase involved in cell wall biosynthesis